MQLPAPLGATSVGRRNRSGAPPLLLLELVDVVDFGEGEDPKGDHEDRNDA